jgi:N6-adenosine-specific RNA methylase IME4
MPRKVKRVPFRLLVADPPWRFSDKLTMSGVKRGAATNYSTMSDEEIVGLGASIRAIVDDNAFGAMWFPGSKVITAIEAFRAWGFYPKGIGTWVKGRLGLCGPMTPMVQTAFGMGRYFRGATELFIFGTRGKCPIPDGGSKSERNVILEPRMQHSRKPEALQDALERMYPGAPAIELFARRSREGWMCVGLECPDTQGEDIHASIERILGSIECKGEYRK